MSAKQKLKFSVHNYI